MLVRAYVRATAAATKARSHNSVSFGQRLTIEPKLPQTYTAPLRWIHVASSPSSVQVIAVLQPFASKSVYTVQLLSGRLRRRSNVGNITMGLHWVKEGSGMKIALIVLSSCLIGSHATGSSRQAQTNPSDLELVARIKAYLGPFAETGAKNQPATPGTAS